MSFVHTLVSLIITLEIPPSPTPNVTAPKSDYSQKPCRRSVKPATPKDSFDLGRHDTAEARVSHLLQILYQTPISNPHRSARHFYIYLHFKWAVALTVKKSFHHEIQQSHTIKNVATKVQSVWATENVRQPTRRHKSTWLQPP